MSYDILCRFLIDEFSRDFATLFMGKPIDLTILSPKELSVQPIRADSLILHQSEDSVLHIEFQTDPDQEIPFRMADYRLRGYRRFGEKDMRQVVIYLRKTNSPLVHQTEFILPQMTHRFEVIRLWEQPTELFLNAPGLLPFAALTRTENAEEVLNEVAQLIERIDNRQQQANLVAASSVLAGLVLDRELINRILRRDIMRESPIYQDILAEGRQEGRQEAIAEIARNLLLSGMSVEQIMNVTGLTRERVEQLTNRDSE